MPRAAGRCEPDDELLDGELNSASWPTRCELHRVGRRVGLDSELDGNELYGDIRLVKMAGSELRCPFGELRGELHCRRRAAPVLRHHELDSLPETARAVRW